MLYLVTPYHVKLKEIQENYFNNKVEHGKSFAFALVIYDPILRVLQYPKYGQQYIYKDNLEDFTIPVIRVHNQVFHIVKLVATENNVADHDSYHIIAYLRVNYHENHS